MMKTVRFIFAWIFLATGAILVNAAAIGFLLQKPVTPVALATQPDVTIASSQDTTVPSSGTVAGIQAVVEGQDARVPILANFLRRHEAQALQPYDDWAQKLVTIADKYNLDFRLEAAIAMQESNLCKKIPEGTFNCLGFGITATTTMGFDSYEASFDRAAMILKRDYIDKGLTTPEAIMHRYTPNSNGSWAYSVNQWMNEMRYDDRQKGKETQTDVNVVEFTGNTQAGSASSSTTTARISR